MKAIRKFLFRQAERRLRRLPPMLRGQARFALHYPGRYSMGFASYGLPEVLDWGEGADLKIGAYCSIADKVTIMLGGHHRVQWLSTYPFAEKLPERKDLPPSSFSRGDVVIGNDVWICTGAIVLSGLTIGNGAVIAAGVVVTGNVEPYAVVAGNPARLIRWRFEASVRQKLEVIAWWHWPPEEVERVAHLLSSRDIEDLLAYAGTRRENS